MMTTFYPIKIIKLFFRLLWLSLTSTAFYNDLWNKYKGYGLKYIFFIIGFTSIIYVLILISNLNNVKQYLQNDTDIANNPLLHILKQWPDLQYNGKILTNNEQEEPLYITNLSGTKILVIDLYSKLNKNELQKVPLALLKDKIILWLTSEKKNSQQEYSNLILEYSKILGPEPAIIDQYFIKSFLLNYLSKIGIVTGLFAIIIFTILRFGIHVSKSFLNMLILYIIAMLMNKKPTPTGVSRVVLFASGPAEFLTPLLFILAPNLFSIAIIIDYWAILLALYAILIKNSVILGKK